MEKLGELPKGKTKEEILDELFQQIIKEELRPYEERRKLYEKGESLIAKWKGKEADFLEVKEKVTELVEKELAERGDVPKGYVLNNIPEADWPYAERVLELMEKQGEIEIQEGKGYEPTLIKPGKERTFRRKPNTRPLVLLKKLGAFKDDVSWNATREQYVKVDNGQMEVKFLDPSRVSMLKADLDVLDLPLEPGYYKLEEELGGDLIALRNPDYVKKEGDKLIFKKYTKSGLKQYELNVTLITKQDYEDEMGLRPEPKLSFDAKAVMTAKELKKIVDVPRTRDIWEDYIDIIATPHEVQIVRPLEEPFDPSKAEDKEALEWVKYRLEGMKQTLENAKPRKLKLSQADSSFYWRGKEVKARYRTDYLKNLLSGLSDSDVLELEFADQMPLKINIVGKDVKGDYWQAPIVVEKWQKESS